MKRLRSHYIYQLARRNSWIVRIQMLRKMMIWWLFDSLCDNAVSPQILRHLWFIEGLFNGCSTKNTCSFLIQFSYVSTLLCVKESFHILRMIIKWHLYNHKHSIREHQSIALLWSNDTCMALIFILESIGLAYNSSQLCLYCFNTFDTSLAASQSDQQTSLCI